MIRLTLLLLLAATLHAARDPRQNIVFILADDLGYGDIGPYGQKLIRTPNLDRLAAEGTVFTHYYAGAAVCSPTRSVLMTGQHTGHTRIRGNHGRAGLARVPLRAEDETVAELLRNQGYATAMIGKWGLGEPGTEGTPDRQGFERWFGYLNNDLAEFHFPEKLWRDGKEIPLPGNAGGARVQYSHDLMTEEALAFLDARHPRPFFLYLAYTVPHSLLEAPEDALAEYRGRFPEPPAGQGGKNDVPFPRATFAAMVGRLDRDVGRILDRIRTLGIERHTVVFFGSDNGAPARAGISDFFGSTAGFRGHKGSLFEGGLRAPMIVRWPGQIPAGRRSSYPWGGWDFLPTALALAGITRPEPGVDGLNVLPALRGKATERPGHLYWEHHQREFSQAVREGRLKAVRERPGDPVLVFDVVGDPGETRDLAAQEPGFVARAEELFRTSRTASEHWPVASRISPSR
ncbi:MAG: arylsulfatase [Opitutaceae bacterium]